MKRNSKLSVALHLLGHLADKPDHPLTSESLASFAATNPVVVRRILGTLKKARLVSSERGHAGGWRLARSASGISIAMVYRALGEGISIGPKSGNENPATCAIEKAVGDTFASALEEAEAVLLNRLAEKTVADLLCAGTDRAISLSAP